MWQQLKKKILMTCMMHLLMAIFLLFSACSSSQTEDIDVNVPVATNVNPEKVLIVYLSRTNNTKAIAEIIHKQLGGALVALELENPYPKNYKITVDQVANEKI